MQNKIILIIDVFTQKIVDMCFADQLEVVSGKDGVYENFCDPAGNFVMFVEVDRDSHANMFTKWGAKRVTRAEIIEACMALCTNLLGTFSLIDSKDSSVIKITIGENVYNVAFSIARDFIGLEQTLPNAKDGYSGACDEATIINIIQSIEDAETMAEVDYECS